MTRFILIACLMAFVVPSQVSAQVAGGNAVSSKEMIDVIYLRDGKIIRGKILEKTDVFLIVRTSDGSISTFQMDQVAGTIQEEVDIGTSGQQSVPKEMIDVIYLRDGKIVRGKILEKTDVFLIVRASDGSISTFQADQIAATLQEEAKMSAGPVSLGQGPKGSSKGISKFRIGAGGTVSPEIGLAANVGYAVPSLNYMDFFGFVEGTFEQFKTGSSGFESTTRFIGANAVMLYKYSKWYFFGGVGFVQWSLSSSGGTTSIGGIPIPSVEGSSSGLNITAGAGMNINKLLFAEARWSDKGGDLVITAGIKIH